MRGFSGVIFCAAVLATAKAQSAPDDPAAVGRLIVVAKPKSEVQLDLTDPDGTKSTSGAFYENGTAKPGTWKIVARAEGYKVEQQSVEVSPNDVTMAKFDLKRRCVLEVTRLPDGALVEVSGPDGWEAKNDSLHARWSDLSCGKFHVKVTGDGYEVHEEDVSVNPGETATLVVKMKKRPAGKDGDADMVRIPGGTFVMGSTEWEDEEPMHRVTVSSFAIDRLEVTVAAYAACVQAGKCTAADIGSRRCVNGVKCRQEDLDETHCNWNVPGKEQHPINCVIRDWANEFCAWRAKRLPTEAEWEYAARGTDGRKFPWGNMKPADKLLRWNSEEGTAPVGTHPAGASPFGVQDMAGNVQEWVADGFAPYSAEEAKDPKHGEEQLGVSRGGGWGEDVPFGLRATFRQRERPDSTYQLLGFRCARDIVTP